LTFLSSSQQLTPASGVSYIVTSDLCASRSSLLNDGIKGSLIVSTEWGQYFETANKATRPGRHDEVSEARSINQ
jgi:hypothetical protein